MSESKRTTLNDFLTWVRAASSALKEIAFLPRAPGSGAYPGIFRFTLQGIPCLYYGAEQGLSGSGDKPERVREALWGKENAFDQDHPFRRTIRQLSAIRLKRPSLRYGRQYFRQVSGDGVNFGVSNYTNEILAYSRAPADLETVVIANTDIRNGWSG